MRRCTRSRFTVRGMLAPAEGPPEDRRTHCFRFRLRRGYGGQASSGRCGMRLVDASNVVGDADDATPSRAGPRLPDHPPSAGVGT